MKLPAWLWPPITGRTFLDVWSLAHFAAGLLIGAHMRHVPHIIPAGYGVFEQAVPVEYSI